VKPHTLLNREILMKIKKIDVVFFFYGPVQTSTEVSSILELFELSQPFRPEEWSGRNGLKKFEEYITPDVLDFLTIPNTQIRAKMRHEAQKTAKKNEIVSLGFGANIELRRTKTPKYVASVNSSLNYRNEITVEFKAPSNKTLKDIVNWISMVVEKLNPLFCALYPQYQGASEFINPMTFGPKFNNVDFVRYGLPPIGLISWIDESILKLYNGKVEEFSSLLNEVEITGRRAKIELVKPELYEKYELVTSKQVSAQMKLSQSGIFLQYCEDGLETPGANWKPEHFKDHEENLKIASVSSESLWEGEVYVWKQSKPISRKELEPYLQSLKDMEASEEDIVSSHLIESFTKSLDEVHPFDEAPKDSVWSCAPVVKDNYSVLSLSGLCYEDVMMDIIAICKDYDLSCYDVVSKKQYS
jgi:hypothetical protein